MYKLNFLHLWFSSVQSSSPPSLGKILNGYFAKTINLKIQSYCANELLRLRCTLLATTTRC